MIDGVNVQQIGQHAAKQGGHLIATTNFNETKLIEKLKRKCRDEDGNISWSLLGDAVGPCFNTVPFAQFYKGPFDEPIRVKEKRVVQKKRKRVDEEGDEENPEEVTQQVSERSERTYEDVQARLVPRTMSLVTFVVELTVSLNFTSERTSERAERE